MTVLTQNLIQDPQCFFEYQDIIVLSFESPVSSFETVEVYFCGTPKVRNGRVGGWLSLISWVMAVAGQDYHTATIKLQYNLLVTFHLGLFSQFPLARQLCTACTPLSHTKALSISGILIAI